MSVEPSPAAMTSAPCEAAPRPNASASGAEEVRMSCMVTTFGAPVSRTKAPPTASATPSSSWSGTTPRMSYALKIFASSPTAPCASCGLYRLLVAMCRAFVAPCGLPRPRAAATAPIRLRRQATEPTGWETSLARWTEVSARAGRSRWPGGLRRGSGARGLPGWPRFGRGRADHPQVTAAPHLDALADRLRRGRPERTLAAPAGRTGRAGRLAPRRLPDGVGQRLEVIDALLHRVTGQPDHVPAPGHGQPLGMLGAQVVAVRLHVRGQRAQHGRGVAVHVGERVDGGLPACGARAATRTHRPTSLT